MRKDYKIAIGTRFGALTVSGNQFYGINKYTNKVAALIPCVCDCGNRCAIPCQYLVYGKTKSCGCGYGRKFHYGRDVTYVWKCRVCGEIFPSKRKKYSHYKNEHSNGHGWSKGLTKETCESLRKGRETLHKHILDGTVIHHQKGKPLSIEQREKISVSMKKAHKEGRAHNIGTCRWNNEPSYPEKFFMRVIEENFEDKNYCREFPFIRFSLDFAWIDKKKCIEIDGDQHIRFDGYKARDVEKDRLLKENGWLVLRIRWKDMFANPKEWISKAKEFIDGC